MSGALLWPLLGGLVLYAIIHSSVRSAGNSLQSKFQKLGNLKGRPQSQIVAAVGPPNSISARAEGGQTLQWLKPGYHIVLIFDADEICQGVTHESKN